MPGELVGRTTQKGGSILVPLLPSAPREHPFVKNPGWISLADWLELCPECPDVQAPGRWGTAGVRCLPRGWALLGRLDCASPSTAGLPAGWAGSVGHTLLVLRLPGRLCLPCAATGDPRVLPWQQNRGLCFQKTSQSPVCGAGLGVWSGWQSPRRGKKRKRRVCRVPSPPGPAPFS